MRVLIYETGQSGGTKYPLTAAFDDLGHSARVFDWEQYLYRYKGVSLLNRVRDRFLFGLIARRINADLRKILTGERFDLLLVVRGDHVYPQTIELARSCGAKVANWNSDDVFNPLNSTKHILKAFPLYDRIFSPRGHLRDEYLEKGARSFETIDWFYRPGLLLPKPTFSEHRYDYDIGFIGAWSPRRERLLGALEGLNVHLWGWGWGKKTPLDYFARPNAHGQVSMENMMAIFSRTKINVNILTHENRDTTNFRNFEIPAAGAFQLSERSPEVLSLFAEGKEISCFDSGEELRAACVKYLRDDASREAVALAAYARLVGGHHSILDRAKQIAAWAEKAQP